MVPLDFNLTGMTIEHFLQTLKQTLRLDSIEADDEFREYDNWDSLMFLSLVAMLEKEFGYKADLDLFFDLDTWQDLYDSLHEQHVL